MKHLLKGSENGGLVRRRILLAGMCLSVAAAGAATEPLRTQTIIDDMTRPHEARLSGVPDSYDWAGGPLVRKGNNPPDDWSATTAWGQIYREAEKAIPANTRIQIRNFELYQLKKSTGKWVKLQDSDNIGIGGGAYAEDYVNDESKKPDVRDEGNRSVSVKLELGYNFHFWPNSRETIDPNDINAMLSVFEARLILDNSNGTDDRNQARLLAGSGGDYWRSLDAKWKSDWSNNAGFALGRLKFVTNDWQYFTACTYDPIGNVGDNPPPPVGDEPEADTEAPQLVTVVAPTETSVEVRFTEEVTEESAEQVGNYSISDGIDVVAATLNADNTSALLTTSALTLGKTYTLTVSNITDRASTPNTGGDQKEFSYTGELQITGLTVASGKSYEIAQSIADGDRQYIDREFTFSSLGDLAGTTCIRTANADKSLSGDQFLSFSANRHVTVYVAYDNRVSAPPPWLSSWDNDGERTGISEAYPDGITVYSRRFDAGTVSIGANGATEYESMYGVFVDAVGDETFVSHAAPHEALHAGSVRVQLSGSTLRVAGLQPGRTSTITLSDARGRSETMRVAAGDNGIIEVSAANRPGGVYVIGVRCRGRVHTTAVLRVGPGDFFVTH